MLGARRLGQRDLSVGDQWGITAQKADPVDSYFLAILIPEKKGQALHILLCALHMQEVLLHED